MKHKELMALPMATHCDDCIGFHMKAAIRAGVTRTEVAETISVAISMGGGPACMYGAQRSPHAISWRRLSRQNSTNQTGKRKERSECPAPFLFVSLVPSGGDGNRVKSCKAKDGRKPHTKHRVSPLSVTRAFWRRNSWKSLIEIRMGGNLPMRLNGLISGTFRGNKKARPKLTGLCREDFDRPSDDHREHRSSGEPSDREHCEGFHVSVSQILADPILRVRCLMNG